MGFEILTSETAETLKRRVRRLHPESARRFGNMTIEEMMEHLNAALRVSLGEIEIEDRSNIVKRTLLKWLAFKVLPWPKGRIKAPQYYLSQPKDFDIEREQLLTYIDKFVQAQSQTPTRQTIHPFVGPVSLQYWGLIHGKHCDHHLAQFGV